MPPVNTLLPTPAQAKTPTFWLCETDPALQKLRTTPALPASPVDVVVVGSGLSGNLTAYHLLKKDPTLRVVMVEATDFCSGATARNGGHCKPLTYFGYPEERKMRGAKLANEMLVFEESHLARYAALVEAEDLDCDLHVTRACDVFFDETEAAAGRNAFYERKKDFPESIVAGGLEEISDPQALEKLSGMKGGKWGITYPAGHLWPYKLAAGLAKVNLKAGLNLQTHTPVQSISPASSSSSALWTVKTSRGALQTRTLIVATNGYTSGILPDFRNKIVPVRGTACSITPPASHSIGSLPGPFRMSYGLRFSKGQSDYMIPRQGRGRIPGKGDKSLILGGAKGLFQHDEKVWYDSNRDDQQIEGARKYFEEYGRKHFVGWSGDGSEVDHVWTGILGYSNDLLPYVGELPSQKGIFILAGFTGHGMPRIPACAESIAQLAHAHTRSSPSSPSTPAHAQSKFQQAIPQPYWVTKQRLDLNINLIKGMMGSKDEGEGRVAVEEPGDLKGGKVFAKL